MQTSITTTTAQVLQPSILVTGATGSFGTAFCSMLLSDPHGPRLRLYSRDEQKQDAMQTTCPPGPRLTYIIGDVRDEQALETAAHDCAAIVHAAALKIVPQGERHANEFIATNVYGTANVARAAIANHVPRSLLISSDKAPQAVNHYGKTKAVAESVFIESNKMGVSRGSRFAIVRGGNVWGSRGSVLDRWRTARAEGKPLIVNDLEATRFYLSMAEWTAFCWRVMNEMRGGEIFLPKCRAWCIYDLAQAVGGEGGARLNGARNGDKRHETMIAPDEIGRTVDIGWAYVIQPSEEFRAVWNYRAWDGERLPADWQYTSDRVERMGVEELRSMII